jgi:hypothetical protein
MKDLMLRTLPTANNDGEFAIAARMWDSDVVLVSGSDAVRFNVRDGRVTGVTAVASETSALIRITGSPDGWAKMMLPVPPPFYQDLFGAAAHHGFTIEGKLEDVYPYYPALRRLIELLRASNRG